MISLMNNPTATQDHNQPIEQIKEELENFGWWKNNCRDCDLDTYLLDIANSLGTPVGMRRQKHIIEILKPTSSNLAHPNSLSRRYALSGFPFHCDTAHWPTPCRFIIIGCKEKGTCERTTDLVDWKLLALEDAEINLLKYATFLIKNGRNSFYSSIIHEKGLYARYDQGCMFPAGRESNIAVRLFDSLLDKAEKSEILWKNNDVIVIDNWRTLHGRGRSSQPSRLISNRELHRILIA